MTGGGQSFFKRARELAAANEFDEAINAYIEGLRYLPEAVEEGHIELRELGLWREANGGAKPTELEIKEYLGGTTALERMLGAEYLLAKDPGHMPYAEVVLRASASGGYKETAKWMADLIFLANNKARRSSFKLYILLRESYKSIGEIERAYAACHRALRLRPADKELGLELKRLSAARAALRSSEEIDLEENEDDTGDNKEAGSEDNSSNQSSVDAAEVKLTGEDEQGRDMEQDIARAKVFFERANEIAGTDNFDYAIDMYLEGLRLAPDALEEGHIKLCELALHRQGKGGKKPTVMDKMKRLRGKTPLEQMLNAEYLFAKDPENLAYAQATLKAAVEGGYKRTATWIANYIFQANNAAAKPSLQIYLLLKDSYAAVGEFDKAVAACQRAAKLKPEDGDLADEFQRLSAEMAVAKGKYDREGDFRQSIKDREVQEKLHSQDSVVKTEDYRVSAAKDARKAYEEDGELPKNIFGLARTLSDLEDDEADNEAIEILEKAYRDRSDFSFKEQAGLIRIKQLKRKARAAKAALAAKSGDAQAKADFSELSGQLERAELEHFGLCVENYPTDLRAKYEYAVCLLRDKRYDDAIPLFQEAQKDPRRRISAMNKTGLCFFHKGWSADAIDVFKGAIDSYEMADDGTGKELRYNLARAYEDHGEREEALEIYRKIAQVDFGFRDVRERIDRLRGAK